MALENKYEKLYWNQNQYVMGIDEAGRGPLAGELIVCGVVFPIGYCNEEINDSKKLSEKKRIQLFEMIKKDALEIYVEVVSVFEIDTLNIYQATKQAMLKVCSKSKKISAVITDAMPFEHIIPVYDMVKGDQKSISVAAASIVAKQLRDTMMKDYAIRYPQYGFEKHKGYGTKKHIEAIHEFGILEIHRKSYQPVKGMLENDSKITRNSN